MNVRVIPELKVIPGGQSIGVKLHSEGMLVVGHHHVESDGKDISPGQAADIRVGDRLLKMNGVKLIKPEQVDGIVQQAGERGEDIDILLARGDKQLSVTLKPVRATESQVYRLGLYIRNATSGVGTLTFYDPEHRVYGALGHVISAQIPANRYPRGAENCSIKCQAVEKALLENRVKSERSFLMRTRF